MRFSLATMLVITAYAALACVAITNPAYHWTSLIWNVSLVVLAVAAVGAITTRGRDQAYWAGFAICGWTHYMFSLGPWSNGRVNAYIFSRPVLDFLAILLERERVEEVFTYDRILTTEPHLNFFIYNEQIRLYVYFLISGFAALSVLSGVGGGWLAHFLFVSLSNPVDKPPADRESDAA